MGKGGGQLGAKSSGGGQRARVSYGAGTSIYGKKDLSQEEGQLTISERTTGTVK